MELIIDNSWTTIVFTEEEEDSGLKKLVEKELHTGIGVKKEGYVFNGAYKMGHWDGITDFYEKDEQRFPTGLVPQVEEILGELQSRYSFTFSLFDDRPDIIIDPEELPKEVKLLDSDIGEITLRDYQKEAFDAVFNNRMSILHIGTGGGKTEIAAGVIKQLQPELLAGETIAFFTDSSEIFHQTAERLEERLGIRVGKYGAGKKDIREVNVVMVPTINASLKIDPEKGLKLSAKEMVVKKMAKDIAPKYLQGINQRSLLKAFLQNFELKTKADKRLAMEIDKVVYESGSDAEVKMKLNGYKVEYEEIVGKKNKKKLEKKKEVVEFLESVVTFISDEHHHVQSDSFYNALMGCTNAIYRIGLTGSIDKKDKFLVQRLKAVTGSITSRVSTKFLVDNGFLAQPKITMTPVYSVEEFGEQIGIMEVKDYQKAYEAGIVRNEYRNKLIAKITEMCYDDNHGVLVIVNRIEHGDAISELLDVLEVPHVFLQGEVDNDTRNVEVQNMRDGELKVMIATTIMDEGVDISGIDSLVLAAGGKSLRQTIQRVGRALRKKKGRENTAHVYDFEDRTNEFLYKHAQERLKIYEQEEFEIRYLD